tara:strand:- start:2571 stop:3902 length:1332 start_codon:yes stop_codon:yes gene_type:complete
MALVLADRVKETTTTTGTGTVTLAGAVSGFQSFAAIGDANTTYYTITSGVDWEVGIGTYTAAGTMLERTTVLSSSAGGTTKITLAGTSNVFATYPAEKSVNLDASNNVGIGTAAPGFKLEVVGDTYLNGVVRAAASSSAAAPGYTFAGDPDTGIFRSAANTLGFSSNGSVVASITPSTFAVTGTASLSGGTVTASTPVIDATQTWNSGGTTFFGWKLNVTNTASASASRLLNLQVGGTSYFQVDKDGRVYVGNNNVSGISDAGANRLGLYGAQGLSALVHLTSGLGVSNSSANPAGFNWLNLTTFTADTALLRSSAGVVSVNTSSTVASDGKLLYRENVIAATTTRSVLSTESGTTFTNEGATAEVPFNLPTAVAGLRYCFIIQDADGIQVNAAAGDTIRIAGSVSATAGLVEATTIGNVVELVAINATEWVAKSVIGTWTVT